MHTQGMSERFPNASVALKCNAVPSDDAPAPAMGIMMMNVEVDGFINHVMWETNTEKRSTSKIEIEREREI